MHIREALANTNFILRAALRQTFSDKPFGAGGGTWKFQVKKNWWVLFFFGSGDFFEKNRHKDQVWHGFRIVFIPFLFFSNVGSFNSCLGIVPKMHREFSQMFFGFEKLCSRLMNMKRKLRTKSSDSIFNGHSWMIRGCLPTTTIIYTRENYHGTWKSPVWKGTSSSKPSFFGFMLIFRGVSPSNRFPTRPKREFGRYFTSASLTIRFQRREGNIWENWNRNWSFASVVHWNSWYQY